MSDDGEEIAARRRPGQLGLVGLVLRLGPELRSGEQGSESPVLKIAYQSVL